MREKDGSFQQNTLGKKKDTKSKAQERETHTERDAQERDTHTERDTHKSEQLAGLSFLLPCVKVMCKRKR